MPSDWNAPGRMTIDGEGGVTTVRVSGNLHRDLAPTERDALEAQLRGAGDAHCLVVDLTDLARLDSWGEEVIAEVVDDVVAQRLRAAIVFDEVRPHHVRSLRVLLKQHGSAVRFGCDAAELRRWVTEAA